MKQLLIFLAIICAFSTLAQEPKGKLFYATQASALFNAHLGVIKYPDTTRITIDSFQVYDMCIVDGNLFAASLFDITVYDTSSYSLIDTFYDVNARHTAAWGNKLVVTTIVNPYFRVYNSQTQNQLFAIDTTIIKESPSDLKVSGDRAFILFNDSVMVVDLSLQVIDTSFKTPHPFSFGGFNTFLVNTDNHMYIDVEYATGGLRFSFIRFDKQSYQVDTVFHKEDHGNFSEPIVVGDSIYIIAFNTHYSIPDDSLYISTNQYWPITIAYDSLSKAIFLHHTPNAISYYQNNSFKDTIAINGFIKMAFFVPTPDSINTVNEPNTLTDINYTLYPNPTSDEFIVEFDLLNKSDISLTLYTINGQEISTLLSGKYNTGLHQFNFSTKVLGIVNGKYLLQLSTKRGIRTKKVVVIK